MKEFRHLGVYGILIKNDKILLIKKGNGPYKGLLDLPGGTIEFDESPKEALKRELVEEVGIKLTEYDLIDSDSVSFTWEYNNDLFKVHHIGIFYKIISYSGEVNNNIKIDEVNDDSMGADFYDIKSLRKEKLSKIVLLELKKLGYIIN